MDVLYRLGRATAAEVLAELAGSPHYSTVRTQLRVLEEKGHVRHESDGLRYVYLPTVARHTARKSGAAPSGRHLLRRVGGQRGYRAARPRCRPPHRRGSRSHRRDWCSRHARRGSDGARHPRPACDGRARGGASIASWYRNGSAALRHFVLAIGRRHGRCSRFRSSRLMPAWEMAPPPPANVQRWRPRRHPPARRRRHGGIAGRRRHRPPTRNASATSRWLSPRGRSGRRGVLAARRSSVRA